MNLLTGYAFLAPYLIITMVFTIRWFFATSPSPTAIFTPPEWWGWFQLRQGLRRFTNPAAGISRLQCLRYITHHRPLRNAVAIFLAVLLNTPIGCGISSFTSSTPQRDILGGDHPDLHVVLPEDRLFQLFPL